MSELKPKAIPPDYSHDAERFRAAQEATQRYSLLGDVHEPVAERMHREGLAPVLDLGCGEGRLIRPLRARGVPVVGLDDSLTMLASVPERCVLADAGHLPFRDACFGGVAALYVLYHLAHPSEAVAEGHRVLAAGGLFVACAPSRDNDPELAAFLPASPATTFDAENGPALVREFFQDVEVERWDAPLMRLPNSEALLLYLKGRGVGDQDAQGIAERVRVPLTLTKRGALIFGYKRV